MVKCNDHVVHRERSAYACRHSPAAEKGQYFEADTIVSNIPTCMCMFMAQFTSSGVVSISSSMFGAALLGEASLSVTLLQCSHLIKELGLAALCQHQQGSITESGLP